MLGRAVVSGVAMVAAVFGRDSTSLGIRSGGKSSAELGRELLRVAPCVIS